MYVEIEDEGIGPSPTSQYFPREYPTFAEDTTLRSNFSHHTYAVPQPFQFKDVVLPQRLDLSSLNEKKHDSYSSKKQKKLSPIKPHHNTSLYSTENYTTQKYKEKTDLDAMKKKFDEFIFAERKKSNKKKHSASSIYSITSSSSSQRSLSVEINRAKKLSEKLEKPATRTKNLNKISNYISQVFEDSDFRFTINSSDDESTRPPSNESWNYHEIARNHQNEIQISKKTEARKSRSEADYFTDNQEYHNLADIAIKKAGNSLNKIRKKSGRSQTNRVDSDKISIGTNTSGFMTDRDLMRIYNYQHDDDNDNDRTIIEVRNAMPPTYRSEETPILCSMSTKNHSICSEESDQVIEIVRRAESDQGVGKKMCSDVTSSQSFLVDRISKNEKKTKFADNCHSVSLPNLQRFVVRPSTRDIYNEPLCIEEIFGKGLRRNPEREKQNFGGSQVAKSVHGENEKMVENKAKIDGNRNDRAIRPTTASLAKQRSISKDRGGSNQPYCSSVQNGNGVSYSVGAVEQQLIGKIKLIIPDWLPLTHKLLKEPSEIDVAVEFRDELIAKAQTIRRKFKCNDEESEEDSTKLIKIERTIKKLDNLLNRGGQRSRVQQLKFIGNAISN